MCPLLDGAEGRPRPSRHPSLQPLHRCCCSLGARMTFSSANKGLQPREIGLIAAALALIADQGSKLFMLYGAGFAHMPPGVTVPVLPFFNLMMVWNPGISYGLFPASGRIGTAILVSVTVAVVLFLIWWMWRSTSRALTMGFGLI